VDGLVALGLFGLIVIELLMTPESGSEPTNALALVLGAAFTLPYAVHRDHAVVALAVCCAGVVAYAFGQFGGYPGYPMFVLVFGIALHGHRESALFSSRSFLSFLAALVTLLIALALQPEAVVNLSSWISTVLVLAVAWLAGENLRARRDRWRQLEQRASRLEVEREERARQAVDAERMRIARELHDVVAHSMSVIAVQAGVAHHVIDTRPQLAREALGAIESTSRSALVELRRMLGVLRQSNQPDEAAALQPGYRLSDLESIAAPLAASGLRVEVSLTGDTEAVPEGVSLSAYRIAQEALTNVLKHGGDTASLYVRCGDSAVVVDVHDPGPRSPRKAPVDGSGQGLIGMRERVSIFGGRLQAEPDGLSGFRVTATLPYGDSPHAATPAGPASSIVNGVAG
jgi:signal transduction histidine kinase